MNHAENDRSIGGAHASCRELLPWYLNRTLDERERQDVQLHLERCDRCRDELAVLAELRQAVREQPDAGVSTATPTAVPPLVDLVRGERRIGWMRWLVAGQAAAIVILGLVIVTQTRDAPRPFALRSAEALSHGVNAPTFRVVFGDSATQHEVRQLLRKSSLEIVGGPTAVGAYTLTLTTVDDDSVARDVLETLRASPLVRLAEPVGRPGT